MCRKLIYLSIVLTFVLVIVDVCKTQEKDELKLKLEVPCYFDVDCPRNSFCRRDNLDSGLCSCKPSHILQVNKTHMDCLPVPTHLGDTCEKDIQCQIPFGTPAACINDTCQCSPQSHSENDGKCYNSSIIGGPCLVNEQCYIEGSLTYCIRGKCECHKYYEAVDNGTRCVPYRWLGKPCTDDAQCSLWNGRCSGVCRCHPNQVVSENQRYCLKIAENINDNCNETAQCTEAILHSKCLNKRCACISGHHTYKNGCWRSTALGDECKNDNQCKYHPDIEDIVECADSKCSCIVPYEEKNGQCRSKNSAGRLNLVGFMGVIGVIFVIKFF